ncbi:hypothetical protein [Paenibacillus sp. L3-i20]|uniref:hypothetical protein n=1 Tax=Paenibacillus sp. L3-i20 TaxID=2905833 RepID=UPI001EDDAD28|nr:hypothetical protein [Paenibacillus sp. L3-i20]
MEKKEVYMNNYQLISDYKDIESFKESFNELDKLVFGLDFIHLSLIRMTKTSIKLKSKIKMEYDN